MCRFVPYRCISAKLASWSRFSELPHPKVGLKICKIGSHSRGKCLPYLQYGRYAWWLRTCCKWRTCATCRGTQLRSLGDHHSICRWTCSGRGLWLWLDWAWCLSSASLIGRGGTWTSILEAVWESRCVPCRPYRSSKAGSLASDWSNYSSCCTFSRRRYPSIKLIINESRFAP